MEQISLNKEHETRNKPKKRKHGPTTKLQKSKLNRTATGSLTHGVSNKTSRDRTTNTEWIRGMRYQDNTDNRLR